MNNLEVLQIYMSKPFEPLYPAAVIEWASKEAREKTMNLGQQPA